MSSSVRLVWVLYKLSECEIIECVTYDVGKLRADICARALSRFCAADFSLSLRLSCVDGWGTDFGRSVIRTSKLNVGYKALD